MYYSLLKTTELALCQVKHSILWEYNRQTSHVSPYMKNTDLKKKVTRDKGQCGNGHLYPQPLGDKDRKITSSKLA